MVFSILLYIYLLHNIGLSNVFLLNFIFGSLVITQVKSIDIVLVKKNMYFLLLFSLYFFSVLLVDMYNGLSLKPVIINFKWLLGFFLLASLKFRGKDMKLLREVLIFFLLIYGYEYLLLGISRPEFLIENNFEMILVFIVYLLLRSRRRNSMDTLILALVVLFSHSKSAFIILLCLQVHFLLVTLSKPLRRLCYVLFSGLLLLPFVFFDFQDAIRVDRFYFAYEFAENLNRMGLFGILMPNVGSLQVQDTLGMLSEYKDLLIDGALYSSVFHGMNLRLIFDFGLLGALLIYRKLYFLLNLKVERSIALAVLLVLFLNGFSVSSINSTYWFLSIILILISHDAHIKKKGAVI